MWNGVNCIRNGILTFDCIPGLYTMAISVALALVGTTSLFLLIFAGIKYITSGGGKQIEEAKNIVTYAIIGLIVVLLAIFVINLIAGITGVRCILTFGTQSCR